MYRKFSADNIFNGYEFLQGQVLITDSAGLIIDIKPQGDAGDDIEKLNGILCPGFVNAHCHLELSHMKGLIPEHSGLVDFVLKVINERHFSDEDISDAIATAEKEMLQNGIVAVGDICNNMLTIPQKTKGNLLYHNFIEASGFPPSVAALRFKRATDIYDTYVTKLAATSIAPHAPYSVSPELFEMINAFAGNNLITMHNQEVEAENEFFKKGTGDFLRLYENLGVDISFFNPQKKSSLQAVLPFFTERQTLILVHNVATSGTDIEFAKRKTQNTACEIFYCLCPNANKYISNTLPDVNLLMQNTNNIVLGTDSLASNSQLSILEEIKTLHFNFKDLGLDELLQWATSNGSIALQMGDTLGSFEKGKQPGLVLIEGATNLRMNKNATAKRIL